MRFLNAKKIRTMNNYSSKNAPPRHQKTLQAATFLSAYLLARDSMSAGRLVSYNDDLAHICVNRIRTTMRSDWYQNAFRDTHTNPETTHDDLPTPRDSGA